MVRCGSPSSKLAQTSEPCFKQKRKEAGHETRRTYTTDFMQYEDINDGEVSCVVLQVNVDNGKKSEDTLALVDVRCLGLREEVGVKAWLIMLLATVLDNGMYTPFGSAAFLLRHSEIEMEWNR